MTFVDGIRARPKVSFPGCVSEERCDIIDSDKGLFKIQ